MTRFLILILAFTYSYHSFSQDTVTISKAELDQKITENNLQIKLAEKEAQLADKELLASRALYLPNVTASYGFTQTNNPMMAFGYKLNQGKITMDDFNPEHLNNPKSMSNFGARLELQQPIINMDGVYQKRAGEVKADAMHIRAERTKEHIQFELNKAYMMLQMAYQVEATLQNARKTVVANKEVIDQYFQNGLVRKSEVLNMDVRLTEVDNQLQTAQSNIRNASDYLYFLIDEDGDDKVFKPAESLTYLSSDGEGDPTLNPDRKDIRAFGKSMEAYDWMIKSSNAKYLPRLNAFGSYDLADNKFAQYGADSYMVGLQLSWNIFDGLKSKSDREKFQTERSKAQTEFDQYKKQGQLQLNQSYRKVNDADAKIKLADQARKQATEAYRILKNRYDQGLEKTSDLLMAESQMTRKELEYQQAIYEHNVALEEFRLLKN